LKTVPKVPEVADHWIASRQHSKEFLRQAVPAYKAALERERKEFKGFLSFAIFASLYNSSVREGKDRIKEA
jgi:hypothetical protein